MQHWHRTPAQGCCGFLGHRCHWTGKQTLTGNIFRKCHGFTVLLRLHRRSCSSKSMLRLCNMGSWKLGLFLSFCFSFFLCPWSSYSISYGHDYFYPFFGLSDQEVVLNCSRLAMFFNFFKLCTSNYDTWEADGLLQVVVGLLLLILSGIILTDCSHVMPYPSPALLAGFMRGVGLGMP